MSQHLCRCVFLILCVIALWSELAGFPTAATLLPLRQGGEALVLGLGQSIERVMAGGESHSYRLNTSAGQYLRVEVFQYWHSVAVRLFDPTGKLVTEVKQQSDNGQMEILTAIAEQSGEFRLEIKSQFNRTPPRGSYTVKLAQQRAATAQDRTLIEADRLQLAAYALVMKEPKSEEVITLGEKGLALYEQVYGATHQALIEPLKLLAGLQEKRLKYAASEALYLRALALAEATFGREHLEIAELLARQASLQQQQAKYATAKPLLTEVLRIREKLLKPDDLRVVQAIFELGGIHRFLWEFQPAETLLRRSLKLSEQTLGATDVSTIRITQELAAMLATKGELGKAEPLFARAVEELDKLKSDSLQFATALLSLGRVNVDLGNLTRAEPHVQRAVQMFERTTGAESPSMAGALALLGRIYSQQKKHTEAEQSYRRVLTIRTNLFGSENLLTGSAITGLATALLSQQKYDEAEPLYLRSIQITEKSANPDAIALAIDLSFLGSIHRVRGKFAEAENCFLRSIGLYEKTLGPVHPYTYEARNKLMFTYKVQTKVAEALREQAIMLAVSEAILTNNLMSGDERQKLGYLERFTHDISGALTLHTQLAPTDPQAIRQAMQVLLLRKGRGLDEMAQVVKLLRQRADSADAELFNQYAEKLKQRAALAVAARTNVAKSPDAGQLEAEIKKIESALSERSQAFRTQLLPVELEEVRAALPAQTALVEFARFKSYANDNFGTYEEQYAAYILLPDGTLRWALLGKAETIDQALTAWRKALDLSQHPAAGQTPPDARKLARQLDALVMQPVRAQLGKVRQVFLAPDGPLNLLPFAALVDERDRELVRDYLFIYLTSGRDLLRLKTKQESTGAVLVFAAPDYDDGSDQGAAASVTPLAADERNGKMSRGAAAIGRFEPLANASAEAQVIKSLWPQAQLFVGKQALERTLKQVNRPQLLHVVTHGVFLEDQKQGADGSVENPLLRSWLALAGANQRKSGPTGQEEDGILTAYEAAALDLWGTKLVVLSACETGLGKVENGEGVYGLRRALVLAGAETQVTSLWRVNDRVTKNLMSQYYGKLKQGMGRVEALRQVQLEMLKGKGNQHPYYWASFIALGEWASLAGERKPMLNGAQRGIGK